MVFLPFGGGELPPFIPKCSFISPFLSEKLWAWISSARDLNPKQILTQKMRKASVLMNETCDMSLTCDLTQKNNDNQAVSDNNNSPFLVSVILGWRGLIQAGSEESLLTFCKRLTTTGIGGMRQPGALGVTRG